MCCEVGLFRAWFSSSRHCLARCLYPVCTERFLAHGSLLALHAHQPISFTSVRFHSLYCSVAARSPSSWREFCATSVLFGEHNSAAMRPLPMKHCEPMDTRVALLLSRVRNEQAHTAGDTAPDTLTRSSTSRKSPVQPLLATTSRSSKTGAMARA